MKTEVKFNIFDIGDTVWCRNIKNEAVPLIVEGVNILYEKNHKSIKYLLALKDSDKHLVVPFDESVIFSSKDELLKTLK